jgi:hypothetical protein
MSQVLTPGYQKAISKDIVAAFTFLDMFQNLTPGYPNWKYSFPWQNCVIKNNFQVKNIKLFRIYFKFQL